MGGNLFGSKDYLMILMILNKRSVWDFRLYFGFPGDFDTLARRDVVHLMWS
jgi:hypothetical protein